MSQDASTADVENEEVVSSEQDAELDRLYEEQRKEAESETVEEPEKAKESEKAEKEGETEDAKKPEPLPYEELEKRFHGVKAAMKEERELRRKYQREQQEQARQLQELQALREQYENPLPDPNVDPQAHYEALIERNQRMEYERRQQQEEAQRQEYIQGLNSQALEDMKEYASEEPAFGGAIPYLVNSRRQEIMGFGYDEKTANDAIEQELTNLFAQAYNQGQNPARIIYQQAQARGYRFEPPQPIEQEETQEPEPPKPNPRLAAINQANKTPRAPKGGTRGKTGKVTESDLNNAENDSEFERLFEQYAKQQRT